MSRTFHHGLRGRKKKFGQYYHTYSQQRWSGHYKRKWPRGADLVTAAILGNTLIPTPPKRKRSTWHFEWTKGSYSKRNARGRWANVFYTRPMRAKFRVWFAKLKVLPELMYGPVPQQRRNRYW